MTRPQTKELSKIFLQGFLHSTVAWIFAYLLFREHIDVAIIALLALSLHGRIDQFLAENREAIWNKTEHPFQANKKTVLQFFFYFWESFSRSGLSFTRIRIALT